MNEKFINEVSDLQIILNFVQERKIDIGYFDFIQWNWIEISKSIDVCPINKLYKLI